VPNRALNLYSLAQISLFNICYHKSLFSFISIFSKMVQTISSSLLTIKNLREGYMLKKKIKTFKGFYFPLIQPLIPKDPIRVLELSLVNCKLGLNLPLNKTEERPLIEELILIRLPLYLSLDKDLEAV
jgi:hypothetical protein